MKIADFWEKKDNGEIECLLCPHACILSEGKSGACGVREVVSGELIASGYGLLSSANLSVSSGPHLPVHGPLGVHG